MPDPAATGPLAGHAGIDHPLVSLTPAGAAARFSLRCHSDDAAARANLLSIGLVLPGRAHGVEPFGDDGRVLWLGPDEWRVVAPEPAVGDRLAEALTGTEAAAVDVSHAFGAMLLDGPAAADVLVAGCSLDLHTAAFPAASCARTRLGKINVVLYRLSDTCFEIEMARSVSRYAFDFVGGAAREFGG